MVTSFDCERDSLQRVAKIGEPGCDSLEARAGRAMRKARCFGLEELSGFADKPDRAKDFAPAT
jgi:hypothetical protein